MRSFLALIRREYIEHKAAFIYAPAFLVGLLIFAVVMTGISGRVGGWADGDLPSSLRFYETVYALAAAGWWFYLVVALFFYFADTFHGDVRNNSMLFWKSMPQSDLKILGAKLATGLTIFPTAIVVAMLATGIVAYFPAVAAGAALPSYAPPSLAESASAWGQISLVAIVYFVVGLLWYLPFFTWIGLLSTIFGRWSIPIGLLIPGVLILLENLVLGGGGPRGGRLAAFLLERSELHFEGIDLQTIWLMAEPIDALSIIVLMLGGLDWPALLGGLVFAAVALYAASEYRRRLVLT